MGAMYKLPNRLYYAQLADLTVEDLTQALQNVMFNCSLKLISLLLLCGVLQYRLHPPTSVCIGEAVARRAHHNLLLGVL